MKYFFIFITIVMAGCGESPAPVEEQKSVAVRERVIASPVKPEVTAAKPVDKQVLQLQLAIDNTIDGKEKLPEVLFSDDNIVSLGMTKGTKLEPEALAKMPVDCVARNLKRGGAQIAWRPKWFFWGTGEVMLSSYCLSSDKSTLAIVELFGAEKGPYGSRIVLIDTYSWSTLAVHTFKNKKIKQIIWGANDSAVYCYAVGQPQLKQGPELFKYTFATESSESLMSADISNMLLAKGELVVKVDGSKKIEILTGEKKVIAAKGNDLVMKTSSSGAMVVFGETSIEVFESDRIWADTTVSHNYSISDAVVLDSAQRSALVTSQGVLVVQDGENFRKITDGVNPVVHYEPASKVLCVLKQFKSTLEFYSVPSIVMQSSDSLTKMRPKTTGEAVFIDYLPHHKKYIVFDTQGNLMLVFQESRRWQKLMIFGAKR